MPVLGFAIDHYRRDLLEPASSLSAAGRRLAAITILAMSEPSSSAPCPLELTGRVVQFFERTPNV